MDLAGLCTYEIHNELVEKLVFEYLRPPMERHSPTSLDQIKRADQHVFTRLADLTAAGIKPQIGGVKPVEIALRAILLEPQLAYLLMQLPGKSSSEGSRVFSEVDRSDKKRKHEDLMTSQRAAKVAKASTNKGSKGPKTSPTAKSSGKGNKKDRGINVPQALIGKQTLTADGKRMCFGYNLGNCTDAPDGGECSKGSHLCMEQGCQKPHPCTKH